MQQNREINVAICPVIRKQKLRKENMSPDFSCAGLIAGRALGPPTPRTGVGFNEKGQEGKRERESWTFWAIQSIKGHICGSQLREEG